MINSLENILTKVTNELGYEIEKMNVINNNKLILMNIYTEHYRNHILLKHIWDIYKYLSHAEA